MDVIIKRIDKGKDLIGEIEKIVKEEDLHSSWILGGIGAIDNIEIGAYRSEREEYERYYIKEPLELVSCQGNVSEEGIIHLHCSVGDGDKTYMGHLFKARVSVFVEIAFLKLDVKLKRRTLNKTLKELVIE
jgi:predicted DNA-binding protein with PD1-like motif